MAIEDGVTTVVLEILFIQSFSFSFYTIFVMNIS